jgi:Peptidase M15
VLVAVNGNKAVVEAQNTVPELIAQYNVYQTPNDGVRQLVRLNVPMNPGLFVDNTKKYWLHATEMTVGSIPPAYTTNCPIGVTSWYRPYAVNLAVGGVPDSQHITGAAVDIYPMEGGDQEFEDWLDNNWGGALGYGQAAGRGFTHIDLRPGAGQPVAARQVPIVRR